MRHWVPRSLLEPPSCWQDKMRVLSTSATREQAKQSHFVWNLSRDAHAHAPAQPSIAKSRAQRLSPGRTRRPGAAQRSRLRRTCWRSSHSTCTAPHVQQIMVISSPLSDFLALWWSSHTPPSKKSSPMGTILPILITKNCRFLLFTNYPSVGTLRRRKRASCASLGC